MSYAKGQSQVDYEERIDFAQVRRERVAKSIASMNEYGLDAVLLWRDENVRYVSSLRSLMLQYRAPTQSCVLLTSTGEIILFCSGGEIARVQKTMPWITAAYPISMLEEPQQVDFFVANVLKKVFTEKGLLDCKVGIDAMTYLQHEAYSKHLGGVKFADGNTPIQKARIIKSSEEMKVIDEATAIADVMAQKGTDCVEAGKRECEIAGEVLKTLYQLGGELPHLANPFVASGERMSPPTRFATDKIIRNGDIVFIDIGASWNGYFGDVGRTTVCGSPSQEQKEIYSAVYEMQMEAIKTLRPGVTNDEVAETYRTKAAEHGFEKNFINLFMGHGIGVCPNEPPYIGEPIPGASVVELKAGMVFALEPLIWVPDLRGGGGIRLEDMVAVTEGGSRVLSRAPYEECLLLS